MIRSAPGGRTQLGGKAARTAGIGLLAPSQGTPAFATVNVVHVGWPAVIYGAVNADEFRGKIPAISKTVDRRFSRGQGSTLRYGSDEWCLSLLPVCSGRFNRGDV